MKGVMLDEFHVSFYVPSGASHMQGVAAAAAIHDADVEKLLRVVVQALIERNPALKGVTVEVTR